jgi:hypothetical protein
MIQLAPKVTIDVTVKGGGGIGLIGEDGINNPKGTWSIKKSAWVDASWIRMMKAGSEDVPHVNEEHDYYPNDLPKIADYSVSGNTLTIYDHPGPPLAGLSFGTGTYNFMITATNGKQTCRLNFNFVMIYPGAIIWREGLKFP